MFLSILMPSVTSLHFDMQEEDTFEHTNACLLKCVILFVDATFRSYKVLWMLKIRSGCFV
jgi:hypothetical protein